MSIDVNGWIAFGAAVLTFIASFLALFPLSRNRTKTITAPIDPLIKAIKVERLPIDQKVWSSWRFKIIVYLGVFTLLFIIVMYLSVDGAVSNYSGDLGASIRDLLISFIFFLILFSPFIIIIVDLPYQIRFRYAKDARFFVFEKANIIVEGDINYLYFKAQEALRGKSVQNIEADFQVRKLEAYQVGSLRKSGGKITIAIDTVNENTKCYSLQVDFVNKNGLKNDNASSAFINQFLGYFLTKQTLLGDGNNKPQ